jgi:hypothetical protein
LGVDKKKLFYRILHCLEASFRGLIYPVSYFTFLFDNFRSMKHTISFEYYEQILGGDPDRIAEMKKLILQDFTNFETSFFEADQRRDIIKMRHEMHKMIPIISNLKYKELLVIAQQYRFYTAYSTDLVPLNKELRQCLIRVSDFLSA